MCCDTQRGSGLLSHSHSKLGLRNDFLLYSCGSIRGEAYSAEETEHVPDSEISSQWSFTYHLLSLNMCAAKVRVLLLESNMLQADELGYFYAQKSSKIYQQIELVHRWPSVHERNPIVTSRRVFRMDAQRSASCHARDDDTRILGFCASRIWLGNASWGWPYTVVDHLTWLCWHGCPPSE